MAGMHVVLGTGPVGRATAEALVARGARVRVASRTGRMEEAPEGAELSAVDIRDRAALERLVAGAEAVYQCAQPEYSRWVTEFPAFQRAVLDAAAAAGARLVLAENLYAYGDRNGEPMRDDSPFAPCEAKGRVRAAMTLEAFAAHSSGRLAVAAARASDFFGPWAWGQSHLGERALGPLAAGKTASMIGRLDRPHSFTYVRDFGQALALLGLTGKGDGRAWLVPNDRPSQTQGEALEVAAGILGVERRARAAGRATLRLASLFVPIVRELVPMLHQFEKPFVVESGSFTREFGLVPTPFDGAMRDTIEWARRKGLLSKEG